MTSDSSQNRFTARELGAMCGVSERTVRYYVEEGLLPPPAGRGRGPNFEQAHLTRLRLIRAMQQAGNDLETIGDYLGELESELAQTGATFESALAVWNGRTEQAVWRDQARKIWSQPDVLRRYEVVDGVELLLDARIALPTAKIREILRFIRQAVEAED